MSGDTFDFHTPTDAQEQDENAMDTALSAIEIDAAKNFYGRCIDLYVFDLHNFSRGPNGRRGIGIMQTPIFKTTPIGVPRDPSFSLSMEAAQRLLDALLQAGVRPSDEGTAGQIGAMKETIGAVRAHLADMQRIVFEFIGKTPRILGVDENIERLYKMAVEDEKRRKREADDAIIKREFGSRGG